MSVNFSAFNTNTMLSSIATAVDSHTAVRAPLSVATSPVASAGSRQQHQQQQQQHQHQHQPQHPITTTKMGSRRIFSAQFKLQVLDSYRQDSDCKGNQRATARKYGIHRRQIQKWLQGESNLRSSIILNNNNNNSNSTNNNANSGGSSSNGSSSQNQNSNFARKRSTPGFRNPKTDSTPDSENGAASIFEQNATADYSVKHAHYPVKVEHSSVDSILNNCALKCQHFKSSGTKMPGGDMPSAPQPTPLAHALDSSSAISPAFTPYMRRPMEVTSSGHFHELPLIPAAAFDSVFHHHHHHSSAAAAAAAAYPFYDYHHHHHHMYAGIPAYLTMPPVPTTAVQSQAILPLAPIRPQSTTDVENLKSELLPQPNSPIDLSLPVARQSQSPARIAKPRPFLPLSMRNEPIVGALNSGISSSSGSAASGSNIDEHKPWDLSRKRRHTDDSDEDEGISVLVSVKASPTPAKVVKLFKPYLLSSDDEDDDAGKKCLPSDATVATTTPPHQNQASFYDSAALCAAATTPTATSSSASYWLNHGSPVSGYDSASSTFSACDDIDDRHCDLPMKNSAIVSAAVTVATSTATKYMVPRRHILEKWSHEEDDAYAHQYGLNYHM